MSHDRNGKHRLRNLLESLLVHQNVLPLEVVVVDTSTNQEVRNNLARDADRFARVKLLQLTVSDFNKCWALNVGIQATRNDAKIIACTDLDFMFGRRMVGAIAERFNGHPAFVMAEPRRLGEDVDIRSPFHKWSKLCRLAEVWSPLTNDPGAGTIQAATREWWFKVHGYDQMFHGGLGGMDDDMRARAEKDNLVRRWITFEEGEALHQWHPRSGRKQTGSHRWFTWHPVVLKNPSGWGEESTV